MEVKGDRTRKTVTLSHKQLGIGTGLAGLLIAVTPITDMFFTRAEGIAQSKDIAMLKASTEAFRLEVISKIEINTDRILLRIRESEERNVKNEDRLERRIDAIDAARKFKY